MDTVERITVAMTELMRRQGYAATGINQLARAADAPTGSIYHHFAGGKRAVAAAALRESGMAYLRLLPELLEPYDDLVAGVEAAFATAAEDMANTGWATMCPVVTVTGEIADVEPELRETAAEVIAMWVEQGAAYLTRRGVPEADSRTAIYAVISALEGAFLLARGVRTAEPFHAAGRSLATYLATVVTDPATRGTSAGARAR